MATLTRKQKVFIEEYLQCWNGAEAARRAGTVISSAVHRDAGHEGTPSARQGTGTPGTPVPVARDVGSDPALTDREGQDWSDEGGATPAGPATSVDPDKLP